MATADVLYGVTLQESGISQRVAVRFGDWEKKNGQNGSTAEPTPSESSQGFAGR
ncbi:MAG: hypothetical protein JNM56_02260 [Planctomycetia bacterium]|nr:hypothetical protein [Planctomycetia bacterium]